MEKENKSNLCRVCLALGEYDIYSSVMIDNEKIEIESILKEFTSLDLENLGIDLSVIPTLICALCFDKLIQCYQFLQQIKKADEHIINILTVPQIKDDDYRFTCKNKSHESENEDQEIPLKNENCELENEDIDIEEYTVRVVDDEVSVIEKDAIINQSNTDISPKTTKIERKRKTYNKKSDLVVSETVPNIQLGIKTKNGAKDVKICKNVVVNKKLKLSNNSTEEGKTRFVITKFIPSETITTDGDTSNQLEQLNQRNNDSTIKTQNVIRTYDLAAVEVDPTDKKQFEKLMKTNFDDADDDNNDDDDDDNSESSAVYACQYCPRAFASSQFLKQHIRRTHTCQFCMKSFEKSTQLFDHIRNSHSEFPCPFCQKTYTINCNLRYHMKKIHSFKLPAHTSLLAFNKKDDESILSTN